MMIWITDGAIPQEHGDFRFGRRIRPGDNMPEGPGVPALIEVVAPPPPDLVTRASAWHVPAGHALDAPLVAALAETQCPIFISVNGLIGGGMSTLRDAKYGDRLLFCLDTEGETDINLLEQLVWMSRQAERFAVSSRTRSHLLLATALGADGLIADSASVDGLGELERILAARRPGAVRPISPSEVDTLSGRELCLTVARPLAAGATIDDADLAIAVTMSRGLSPALREAVVGCRLRYAVAPGEPLHFGLLRFD